MIKQGRSNQVPFAGFLLAGWALLTFSISASAQIAFAPLAAFTGTNGNIPGSVPEAALVQGSDGNFYGTTILGGTNLPGFGTIFKLAHDGTVTSRHRRHSINSPSFPDREIRTQPIILSDILQTPCGPRA